MPYFLSTLNVFVSSVREFEFSLRNLDRSDFFFSRLLNCYLSIIIHYCWIHKLQELLLYLTYLIGMTSSDNELHSMSLNSIVTIWRFKVLSNTKHFFFFLRKIKCELWDYFNITVRYFLYLFPYIKWNDNIHTKSDFSNSSEESNGAWIVFLLEIVFRT